MRRMPDMGVGTRKPIMRSMKITTAAPSTTAAKSAPTLPGAHREAQWQRQRENGSRMQRNTHAIHLGIGTALQPTAVILCRSSDSE